MTVLTPAAAAASTVNSAGFEAAKAIDGDATINSRWAAGSGFPQWLRLDMGSAVAIDYYSIAPGQYDATQDPAAWTFEGSNDTTSWTTLDTKSAQTFAGKGSRAFAATGTYRYYRLNISAAGGGIASISEFQVGTNFPAAATATETVTGTVTNGSSVSATITATPAAGQTVVAAFQTDAGGIATCSGLGATWTKVYEGMGAASGGSAHSIWVGVGATSSGAVTGTTTSGSLRNVQLIVNVVSNLASPKTIRTGAYNTATLASPGQMVIGSVYESGGGSPVLATGSTPAPASWTLGTRFDPSGTVRINQAWRFPTAEASHNLTWSGLGSAGADQIVIGMPATVGTSSTTGTVQATLPPLSASVAGAVTTPGAVAATLPPLSASVAGTVTGPTTGTVNATLPSLTVSVQGSTPTPITGAVGATLPSLSVKVTDDTDGAEAYVDTAGDIDAAEPHDVTGILDTAEANTYTYGDAAIPVDMDGADGVEAYVQAWATAVDTLTVALDPATGRPQYSLKVVDMDGNVIETLEQAHIGRATRALNARGGVDFTLPKDDPALASVTQFCELQLWRGANLVPGGWFVNVDPAISALGNQYRFQCSGLRWYFEGRRIGRELPELLVNGGFEDGIKGWTLGWSEGSNAEAPPEWEITTDAREGGKALRVFAKDVVVVTSKSVETAAIFYGNRPYASEPLSAGFLPGGEQIIRDQVSDVPQGASVLVEGYTADVDGGTGQALSQRRADAAKAVILAYRPDLSVTAIGRGETVQVAPNNTPANQAKNRRIVITATSTQTKIGHRQWAGQSFRYTHPSAARSPLEIDVQGQIRIDTWEGPSKDGWGLHVEVRKVSDLANVHNDGSFRVDETFRRQAWGGMHTDVKVPADDQQYEVRVQAYPTAGSSSFDQMSATPNLKLYTFGDMADALRILVEHAQDPAFGKSDLRIDTYIPPTGNPYEREWAWRDRHTIDGKITEILTADNGPDADIAVTPTRRVFTAYPGRKGRQTGLTFALGDRMGDARVVAYEAGIDGDNVATTAIVQSSWSGGGQAEVFVREPRADGLVLERLYQADQDVPTSTILEQGRTAVRYGRTDVITKIWMDPADTTYLLQEVDIGDTFNLDVQDGETTVMAEHRIIEYDLDPDLDQLCYTIASEV